MNTFLELMGAVLVGWGLGSLVGLAIFWALDWIDDVRRRK